MIEDQPKRPNYDALVYDDRLVAFVDVLGWSAAVQAAGADGARDLGWLVVMLQDLERQAEAHERFASSLPFSVPWPGATRGIAVTQFSDSIVISLPAKDPAAMWTMELYLSQLCSCACQSGFLVRGGLVRGLIYHRDRIVYGPALIAAYRLEQDAKFPRILISSESIPETEFAGWLRDEDGELFFDYLRSFHALPDQYRHLICRSLMRAKDQRVLDKYLWMMNYFRRVIGDSPDNGCIGVAFEVDGQLIGFPPGKWPSISIEAVADDVKGGK